MGKKQNRHPSNPFTAIHPDVYRHLLHLPLLSYSLFVPRQAAVKTAKKDGFPPIILVHGLGGRRGDLLPMECYLRFSGRKRTYRIGIDDKRSLSGKSRSLALFIQKVLQMNDCSQVDIVAYSLGGIVARLAILDHGIASHVRRLVTLGTPHRGTIPARYMDTRLIRDLHPDSPVIQRLNRSKWPKGIKGTTFWSKNDLFVLPSQSASVSGTTRIDMSPFTHFSYLIDPKSWSAVKKALV